jgi:hypothetical protein
MFEVNTPLGFIVTVTHERWLLLSRVKHPVMAGREDDVKAALSPGIRNRGHENTKARKEFPAPSGFHGRAGPACDPHPSGESRARTGEPDKPKSFAVRFRVFVSSWRFYLGIWVSDPDQIRRSRRDPRVHLFYRQADFGRWTCVVAKRLNDEGFLITAYPTDKIKEGDMIWNR